MPAATVKHSRVTLNKREHGGNEQRQNSRRAFEEKRGLHSAVGKLKFKA